MSAPQTQKCPHCGHETTHKIDGMFALTKIEKSGENVVFFPNNGIPTVVYVCPKCGFFNLYSAKVLGEI